MAYKRAAVNRGTPRQKALVKALIENPQSTLRELAVKSGYNPGSPNAVAQGIASEYVQKHIKKLMEADPELMDPALLTKLKEGLNATEPKYGKKDYGTRHKYLTTALNLKGHLTDPEQKVTNNFYGKEAYDQFCQSYFEAKARSMPQGPETSI